MTNRWAIQTETDRQRGKQRDRLSDRKTGLLSSNWIFTSQNTTRIWRIDGWWITVVFSRNNLSTRKRGSALNGTGTESSLLFSKRTRRWGFLCKKTINEYRSGSLNIWHTVIRNTGMSQLMIMSNKWIFLSPHSTSVPIPCSLSLSLDTCTSLSVYTYLHEDVVKNTLRKMHAILLRTSEQGDKLRNFLLFSKFLDVFLLWI